MANLELPPSGSLDDIAFQKWKGIPHDTQSRGAFAAGVNAITEAVVPLLRRLANEAWMRQDFATNAAICKLLGEPSAEEHERRDDAP